MLPTLKKSNLQQFQASEIKLYHPPRQLNNLQIQNQRKSSFMASSSRANSKVRVKATGFIKKQQTSYDNAKNTFTMKNSLPDQQNYATLNNQPQFLNKSIAFAKLNSNKDLSAEIKLIQKKIRYHKKKLQQEKRKKQQQQKIKSDPYSHDFDKIIRKQMQQQGYINSSQQQQNEHKGFDYLTNPGKLNNNQQPQYQQQQPQVQQALFIQEKKFDLTEKIQKLQKHYENNLKKKFERRQMFPHYPCKRKTPKLYVTAKTNALQKYGKKPAQEQHLFRVMTKQCTPQQIYPTIPNFAIVKDNLSKNVLAYLTEFKPFIDKTKEDVYDDNENNNNNSNNSNEQQLKSGNSMRQNRRQEKQSVNNNANTINNNDKNKKPHEQHQLIERQGNNSTQQLKA